MFFKVIFVLKARLMKSATLFFFLKFDLKINFVACD